MPELTVTRPEFEAYWINRRKRKRREVLTHTGMTGATDNGDGTFTIVATNCRFTFDAAELIDGANYEITFDILSLSGGDSNFNTDFCDTGNNIFTSAGTKRYSARRADYDATFRFVDAFVGVGVTATFRAPTLRRT